MSYQSAIFDKIQLTNSLDFKIPETASIVCNGGGYFKKGIAIGNNESDIPGSLRYNFNGLELKLDDSWVNIKGFDVGNGFANSIIIVNDNNLLQTSNIIIDDKDIYGINNLEVNNIISSDVDNLYINYTKWPSDIGKKGDTLVYSDDGVLSVNKSPVVYYTNDPPTENDIDGKKGTISFDKDYLYICVEDNCWKKVGLIDI
jgi:hypothetical protein